MADYYPVLARAIAALDPNTAGSRQQVYDRARAAISRQLKAIDPPVPQETIDRELSNLEDVIATLEAEQTKAEAPLIPLATPPADPPPPARPQVQPRTVERGRKPWIGVVVAVGAVVVATIATIAYLRRHEPPAMANRPLSGASSAQNPATQQPTVTKSDERVAVGSSEAPPRPSAPTPPAPAPRPAPAPVAAPPPAASSPAPAAPVPVAPASPPPVASAPPPAPTTTAPPPSAPQQIAIASRLVLVVESAEAGQPLQVRQGSVVWRTETVSLGQGQAAQMALKATMDIPDARLRAEMTLQRNRDTALPASHTIQLQFQPLAGSDIRGVQTLSVMELRQTENQAGYAIAGQGIAVTENLFLIALTQAEPALSRNIDMLRTRPMVYFEFQLTGGRRAAIIMEKGATGQQAMDEAFRSWQQ